MWILTPGEAREILQAFQFWAEGERDTAVPGWHMHLTEDDLELTLAIDSGGEGTFPAEPS